MSLAAVLVALSAITAALWTLGIRSFERRAVS
jgi:hypothetical protein